MAVDVKVNYETEEADAKVNASQAKIASSYEKLGLLAEKALKLDSVKNVFGGLKDGAEQLLPLLGESGEAIQKNIDGALKMAKAGSAIGSAFGPLGSIIGGGIGAAVGYFAEAEKAAQETEKATRSIEDAVRDVEKAAASAVVQFNDLGATDLSGLIGEIGKLQEQADKLNRVPLQLQEDLDALTKKAVPGLVQAFDRLSGAALGDEFRTQGKSLDDLNTLYIESEKRVKGLSDEIAAEGKAIKDNAALNLVYGGTLVSAEKDLKNFETQSNAARAESAAYKAAIDAATKSNEAATPKVQAHTKAIQGQADAQRKLDAELQRGLENFQKGLDASRQKEREDAAKREIEIAEGLERVKRQLAEDAARADVERIKARDEELQQQADASYEKFLERQASEVAAYQAQTEKIKAVLEPFGQLIGKSFDIIATNIAKGEKPLAGFGTALRGFLADILKTYAKKWGIQALGETAEGLAALAGIVTAPLAPAHFAAAATFGAAAIAAGGASLLAGRNTQVPAPATSGDLAGASSSSGFSSNPSLGGRDRGGASTGGNISVTLSNNMFLEGGDRDVARAGHRLAGAISASRRDLRLDTGVN